MRSPYAKWLLIGLALTLLIPGFSFASKQDTLNTESQLAQYLNLYGVPLTEEILDRMHSSFSADEAVCGPVRVSFDEVLYDGQWLYTAATAWPEDPESVLVLPGGMTPEEPVVGYYIEGPCNDKRSFAQVAQQEHKQLIAVYAYPQEFDALGLYFLDALQETPNQFILFSGAQLAGGEKPVTITWSIQIYDVNLYNGKYDLHGTYQFPLPLQPLGPYKERIYHVLRAKDEVPFESVKLVQTPLATYLLVDWNSEKYFFVELIDESGQPLEPKGSISMNSYAMEDLPDRIYLSVSDPDTEQTERVEAVYVQDETVSRGRE